MGDSVFHLLDELDQRGRAPETRQYPITQPQCRAPPQPIPPRDRYRLPRPFDDLYDMPDASDQHDRDAVLDSFDQELLERPYDDRQKRAERGEARLSFPPKASKYFDSGYSSQPAPSHAQGHGHMYSLGGRQEHAQPLRPNLSQFVYSDTQPQESSSDPQIGASSSPAFKASKRRAEQSYAHIAPWQTTAPQHIAEYQVPETPRRQEVVDGRSGISPRPARNPISLPPAGPIIHGISLIQPSTLPDRLRPVFPFQFFNPVQSKCFDRVFKSDNNFVLASPTGSGKTAVLELAICRTVMNNAVGQYKIVYQAPIKALCAERQRDWQKKFSALGLKCTELTGDSDGADLRSVQTADIIITTPEKWDSITRKWKDHEKLMRLIKLFLIDEVHFLKEERGPTLEAVVSRMKTIGTDVRFVALSATIPNFDDVATWLGKNPAASYEPADNERFGEEFRPVKLKKHVCGYPGNANDFQFDNFLDSKLSEVIARYSERKPIMVFCFTRKSTVSTAKMLASWWSSNVRERRYWKEPSKPLSLQDEDLRGCVACGVSFHHAGLDLNDRLEVEKGFMDGDINVICCTSTLAVGVNLPCHFVVVKNTVTWSSTGIEEYSDLEVMQMIGRAGRPQFDESAVAVIMTRQSKVRRYETMVTGQDILESKLHLGLIEHLNAEVALGTIRDLSSARKWLSGTFMYVRLKRNPTYYRLEGTRSGQDIDEQLDHICLRDLDLLQDSDLITGDQHFRCTDFGAAMARYYVRFETMQVIVGLRPKTQISEILSALSQVVELGEIRFRAGEKALYKALNGSPSIRFPIPVTLNLPAHKVSIIIQSVLGAADIIWDKETQKHKTPYLNEVRIVFKHIHRLIRCIADCQISLGDSKAVQNALLVQRSIRAQAWDDGPLQMKQIPEIGVVSVRKLVNAGIRSMEELEYTEAHRIEMVIGRNPPFGRKIQEVIKSFPKLRVSAQISPNSTKRKADGVEVQVKVELGFLNDKTPNAFQGKAVYVCLLAETSDGRMMHFARIKGLKIGKGVDLTLPALLTSVDQSINCYVMCDEIAGTMREATVNPKITPSWFPGPRAPDPPAPTTVSTRSERPTSNTSRRRADNDARSRKPSAGSDEFDDDGIDDEDLVEASFGDLDFEHIEHYANPTDALTRANTAKNASKKSSKAAQGNVHRKPWNENDYEPKQLANGKWACNHACKNKDACKHFCCKEGTDKPPKPPKKAGSANESTSKSSSIKQPEKETKTQTKLTLMASKRKSSGDVEVLDLTQQGKRRKSALAMNGPKDYRNLHELHKKVQKKDPPASIAAFTHQKPAYCYAAGGVHNLSFLDQDSSAVGPDAMSSDYGDFQADEVSTHLDGEKSNRARQNKGEHSLIMYRDDRDNGRRSDHYSDLFGDDDSLLGEVMVGLADSQDIQAENNDEEEGLRVPDELFDIYHDDDLREMENVDRAATSAQEHLSPTPQEHPSPSTVQVPTLPRKNTQYLLVENTGVKADAHSLFTTTESMSKAPALRGLQQARAPGNSRLTRTSSKQSVDLDARDNEVVASENRLVADEGEAKEDPVAIPDAYKDLEPWLFAEFGDIVELVDN